MYISEIKILLKIEEVGSPRNCPFALAIIRLEVKYSFTGSFLYYNFYYYYHYLKTVFQVMPILIYY